MAAIARIASVASVESLFAHLQVAILLLRFSPPLGITCGFSIPLDTVRDLSLLLEMAGLVYRDEIRDPTNVGMQRIEIEIRFLEYVANCNHGRSVDCGGSMKNILTEY